MQVISVSLVIPNLIMKILAKAKAREWQIPNWQLSQAANAPGTISKLEEWGVEFEHVEDDYYIFKSCFSRAHVPM